VGVGLEWQVAFPPSGPNVFTTYEWTTQLHLNLDVQCTALEGVVSVYVCYLVEPDGPMTLPDEERVRNLPQDAVWWKRFRESERCTYSLLISDYVTANPNKSPALFLCIGIGLQALSGRVGVYGGAGVFDPWSWSVSQGHPSNYAAGVRYVITGEQAAAPGATGLVPSSGIPA
jgi:hypothetical protein